MGMKKAFSSALFFGMIFSSATFAASPSIPVCDPAKFEVPYHYIVSVNDGDSSQREDLVTLFQVFGTGGFEVKSVLNFGQVNSFVHLAFSPEYYGDADRAQEVLEGGLRTLVSLQGVAVVCDKLSFPAPAITIRN